MTLFIFGPLIALVSLLALLAALLFDPNVPGPTDGYGKFISASLFTGVVISVVGFFSILIRSLK